MGGARHIFFVAQYYMDFGAMVLRCVEVLSLLRFRSTIFWCGVAPVDGAMSILYEEWNGNGME